MAVCIDKGGSNSHFQDGAQTELVCNIVATCRACLIIMGKHIVNTFKRNANYSSITRAGRTRWPFKDVTTLVNCIQLDAASRCARRHHPKRVLPWNRKSRCRADVGRIISGLTLPFAASADVNSTRIQWRQPIGSWCLRHPNRVRIGARSIPSSEKWPDTSCQKNATSSRTQFARHHHTLLSHDTAPTTSKSHVNTAAAIPIGPISTPPTRF